MQHWLTYCVLCSLSVCLSSSFSLSRSLFLFLSSSFSLSLSPSLFLFFPSLPLSPSLSVPPPLLYSLSSSLSLSLTLFLTLFLFLPASCSEPTKVTQKVQSTSILLWWYRSHPYPLSTLTINRATCTWTHVRRRSPSHIGSSTHTGKIIWSTAGRRCPWWWWWWWW